MAGSALALFLAMPAALRTVRPAVHAGKLLRSPVRLLASAARGTSQVQRIYDRAAAGDLCGTMEMMDLLTAAEVGLEPHRALPPGSPVGYYHVYKDPLLSIGIFVIPAGGSIPLHDHPGMTVLSKLLFGSLRVTTYDMPDGDQGGSPPRLPSLPWMGQQARPLRVGPAVSAVVSAPCATLRLEPHKGNIHQFNALQDTAIFDVLTPPYDDFAGRSCHYYELEQADPADPASAAELHEVGWPPELRVASREYLGPSPSSG